MVNGYAADVAVDDGTLAMTLLTQKLWFRDEQGVLLWTPVAGDFSLTGTISTSRATDPAQPLEQNGTVQLGGLMARDPSLPSENYVFIVAGNDADGPAVETKTTRVSQSTWDGPDWPAPDADLRICRVGDTFRLLKRPADADQAWELALEVDRPDMESELQVGPNIYSDGPPDLAIRYEDLTLETGTPADGCEAG